MTTDGQWQNRIVGYGEEDPEQLLANPSNWRVHPKSQQDALLGVLEEVGVVQDVIVSKNSGFIVDGHLRVSLALRTGQPMIPVKYVDLTEKEEALILATFDSVSTLATADLAKLEELLTDVQTGNVAVQQMIDELAEQAGRVTPLLVGAGGDEFDATPEEDGPRRTQGGDLWRLGEHRLLVGDSTVLDNITRLMDGQKAEMIWTDPPYGVAIGDKNKLLNSIGPSNRIEENLTNDTLDEAGILAMLRGAFAAATSACLAGGAWYVAAPPGPLHLLWGQALNELKIWRQTIQWVKNNATFSPMGVDYHWRAEPIFYGWLPGVGHRYYGGRTQDTVWEINRPNASPDHPTMKPIELVSRAVVNSSKTAELVLDPFLGSGTTIIACERLGRKCYGLELEPKYADVILRRWEAETGKEAVLLERLSTSEQPPTDETDGSVDASL